MFRPPESESPAQRANAAGASDASLVKPQGEHTSLFLALVEALRDPELNPSDCSIYATLLAQPLHERDGFACCRPSRVRLAKESRVHPFSVRRSTARLVEQRYIDIALGAGRSTNRFTLLRVRMGSTPATGSGCATGSEIAASEVAAALPLADGPLGSRCAPSTDLTGSGCATQYLEQPQSVALSRSCDRFGEFWTVYPRKEAKAPAAKAWSRQSLDRAADQIVADILARIADPDQWRERRYIPLPASYLNARRWEDQWQLQDVPKRAVAAIARDTRTQAEMDAATLADLQKWGMGGTP